MGVKTMITTILVKCSGETVEFDTDALPAVTNEFVVNYGFKQWVNDGAAKQRKDFDSDEEYEAARVAGAQDRIERLRAGDVPGTRAPADPNLAKARKLAKTAEAGGVDIDALLAAVAANPEKLANWLAKQAASGRAA